MERNVAIEIKKAAETKSNVLMAEVRKSRTGNYTVEILVDFGYRQVNIVVRSMSEYHKKILREG